MANTSEDTVKNNIVDLGDGVYVDSYTWHGYDPFYSTPEMKVGTGWSADYQVLINTNTGATVIGNSDDGYIYTGIDSNGTIHTYQITGSQGHNIKEYSDLSMTSAENVSGLSNQENIMPYYVGMAESGEKTTINIDGKDFEVAIGTNNDDINNLLTQYVDHKKEEGQSSKSSTSSSEDTSSSAGGSSGDDTVGTHSVDEIINDKYSQDDDTILYEKKIPISSSTNFNQFENAVIKAASAVCTNQESVEGILSSSNSNAFYSGTSAITNLNSLGEAAVISTAASTCFNSVTPTVTQTILQYNDHLVDAKHKVRLNLAKKSADAINRKNIKIGRTKTGVTKDQFTNYRKSEYVDHIYRIDYTYKSCANEWDGIENKFDEYSTKYIDIKYDDVANDEKNGPEIIEKRIEDVGQTISLYNPLAVEDYDYGSN